MVYPPVLALALFWSAQLPPLSGLVEEPPSVELHIDPATVVLVVEGVTARFAVMFFADAAVSVPKRDSRSVVACGGERVHRSSFEPVVQLPVGRRHSAGLRHHRFRCSYPQQAVEARDGSVLRCVHLRVADAAVANHLWACHFESIWVRDHCRHHYPAASRAELVPGREARDFSEISSQAAQHTAVAEQRQPG